MNSLFFLLGSISGGLAIAFGAFGAHALKARLTSEALATFETGVRYQMYHALALLVVALVTTRVSNVNLLNVAGWLFVVGTLLFSGSLYLLCFTKKRWLGAITPFGGLAFIAGWLLLALVAISG